MIHVGTAGWSIPRAASAAFPNEGSHLARYARVFSCAEINSSFYRDHSAATYAKWAAATPAHFRFAIKLPQAITHEGALRRARRPLETFLAQTAALGRKRGPLLVQLPPSLTFERRVARTFFQLLRTLHAQRVVCEPRHASWFDSRAEALMLEFDISRVAADPVRMPAAAQPGGSPTTHYYRWHGSPRKYWSRYSSEQITQWGAAIRQAPAHSEVWCIFDNTASGSAIDNALELSRLAQRAPLRKRSRARR
jgi:uncharacterized protein YecE (DUF72 family)